jgi:hypothetical protein
MNNAMTTEAFALRAAHTAIAESAVIGRTMDRPWSVALGEALLSVCHDYETVPGGVEMWGKTEAGKSWTVRLTMPKSARNA